MYAVSGLEIILNRHMNELKKQIILLLSWIYYVFLCSANTYSHCCGNHAMSYFVLVEI